MNAESPIPTSPATNPSGSADRLSCPSCGTANDRDRRFCNDCGEALTFSCPECNSERSADEKHCGQCGFGLSEFIKSEHERCQALLDQAKAIRNNTTEAIKVARTVLQDQAPFISRIRADAAKLVKELNAAIESAAAEVDTIKDKLRDCVARRDFSEGNRLLASLNLSSADKELAQLIEKVETGYQRIVQLRNAIQQRINEKQYSGLYHELIELQTISPNEKGITGLIAKFGEYELNRGKSLYKKQNYAEASELLQELPNELLGDVGQKLVAQAKELSTCQCYFQESPVADVHLLRIGEKLLHASGGNERIEKLVTTLKTRLSTAKKETGCELAVWASAGDSQGDSGSARITVLPCCSTATWKINLDPKAMQSWRQNFFEWQVAGGAAAQLLGLARVNSNLAPPKKKGLFRRKETVPTDCLGVAISGTTAHLVRVQVGDDGNPTIMAYDIQKLAGNTETARTTAIQELLDRNDVDGLPIAVTVAARHCISRYSEVPKFDNEKKQIAAVEFEAKHQIPYPLEGLCWDKYVGGENVTEDLATIDVLLLASRKEHIEQAIASFGDRASDVSLVQSDALALQNWASTAWSGIDSVGKSRAIISIGERETHVAVIGQSTPFHNTVSWGINDVRLTIEKQLELNPKEVEVILRAASQAKRIAPVAEAFESSYEDLVGQLRRSFTGFERAPTEYKPVDEIVLMGEGCTLFGLARYLRLNPPTE